VVANKLTVLLYPIRCSSVVAHIFLFPPVPNIGRRSLPTGQTSINLMDFSTHRTDLATSDFMILFHHDKYLYFYITLNFLFAVFL
jgi:hypothetical protein